MIHHTSHSVKKWSVAHSIFRVLIRDVITELISNVALRSNVALTSSSIIINRYLTYHGPVIDLFFHMCLLTQM